MLDGNARHGLVAIRRLGQRGLQVTAGSETRFNAGSFSKYVSRRLVYPSPESETSSFLDAIEQELRTHAYDMILPINQHTVEIVVHNRARFEKYTVVPFPPTETLDIGLDKAATIKAAQSAGIPHPKTLFPDEQEIETAFHELDTPVVVKPCRGSSRNGVSICHSQKELEQVYRETTAAHGPVLLQEFVPNGGERGVYALYNTDSDLVRVTVQRRLRSNPPEGGASTYRETITDPELITISDHLLGNLDWQGVAMVEYRIDARSGTPVLMEINPRLWGSLALSVFAGVDFPVELYRLAMGESVERDLEYDVGVRARCVFTDAQQVLAREDKLRALHEFFQPSEYPCCYDVLSWDDPLTALGQLLYYAGRIQHRIQSNGRQNQPTGTDPGDESLEHVKP